MTNEDPTTAIMNTEKLYHVHFDNNDGKNDLHTPLDVGTMPLGNLEKAIKALKLKKYDGYYSLELLNLQNPIKTLKENIQILKEIYNRV
jgi:sugar phosphate isomerase/epimerase